MLIKFGMLGTLLLACGRTQTIRNIFTTETKATI
jgi:hypothetical protein